MSHAVRPSMAQAPAKPPAPLTETERAILARLSETLGEPAHLDELVAFIPATPTPRARLLCVHIFRLRQKIEPSHLPPIGNPTTVRMLVRCYSLHDGIPILKGSGPHGFDHKR